MIQSMTSYGRHTTSKKNYSIEIEIKSLNYKFFDFNIRNSPQIELDENRIRSIIKKKLIRGKIDVTVSIFENSEDYKKIIDLKKFKNLYKEIKSLGTFKVNLNLHSDIQSTINIKVISKEEN